jgi:hypothetical protein
MGLSPARWARPEGVGADRDDELLHVVCCVDNDVALCSTDVTGAPWDTGNQDCVVCIDLERSRTCPRFDRCRKARRGRFGWGRKRR